MTKLKKNLTLTHRQKDAWYGILDASKYIKFLWQETRKGNKWRVLRHFFGKFHRHYCRDIHYESSGPQLFLFCRKLPKQLKLYLLNFFVIILFKIKQY